MRFPFALFLLAALAPGSEELPYISGFQPRDHVLTVEATDTSAAAIPALFKRSIIPAGATVNKLAGATVPTIPESFRGDYFAGWVANGEVVYQEKPRPFTLRGTSVQALHRDGPVLIDLLRIQHVNVDNEDLLLVVAAEPVAFSFQTLLLRRVGPREMIGYHLVDDHPGKRPFHVLFYKVSN